MLNLKNYPRQAYTINQFTQPSCYELEGESFYFDMDDGYDYELHVTDKDTCEWNLAGQPPKQEKYKCLKGDDTTYLLHHETDGSELRTCITYVIDLDQRLVTILTCKIGLNPKYPFLVSTEFDFGAIRVANEDLPFKRHSFTDDLLGTCVEWHWKSDMYTQHAYNSTTFYRITGPRERAAASIVRHTPSSDEWARYVKIKNNMYLFALTESYLEKMAGAKNRHRSNSMVFLQNYDRMYHVGRLFANKMVDGKPIPDNILFGAFGKPVVLDSEFLSAPNPYIV